jgi:putative nucleotidyltransferase with HDIG domain
METAVNEEGVEAMPEDYYAKEDIYGENGVLLLGKGQRITEKAKERLKKFKSFKPDTYLFEENNEKPSDYASWSGPRNDSELCSEHEQKYIHGQIAETSRIINALKARMCIHDDCVLETPNKVLNTIIFDSKTEPWWIYVNALSNYVSWVYTHSIDVAIISIILAKELGYDDKELWNIGLGAFLHDVGKLLIPKEILENHRVLDACETDSIQQHCELGMISLKPFCLAKECTDIVMQHHERLDGSGYPRGLKSDEICRNARIVMVADAFDAITSWRPYRKPKNADDAIRMLRDEGARYPQDLVSLLEQILK